jgi:hypothetical protein
MIDHTLDLIESALSCTGRTRSTLVALTGIDGSGKGYVARLLARQLGARALRTVVINVGRWLNPPEIFVNEEGSCQVLPCAVTLRALCVRRTLASFDISRQRRAAQI